MAIFSDPVPSEGLVLTKFCKPEHNLARGCNTLALGTMLYYKGLETEIGDSSEMVAVIGQSTSVVSNGMYLANNAIIAPTPNAYIFCASMTDNPKFEGYNDKYEITNIKRFGKLIAGLIAQQCVADPSQFNRKFYYPINILPLMRDVVYGKAMDSFRVSSISADNVFESSFRKPKSYAHEHEYRFSYYVHTQVYKNGKSSFLFHEPNMSPLKILDLSSVRNEIKKIVRL